MLRTHNYDMLPETERQVNESLVHTYDDFCVMRSEKGIFRLSGLYNL